MRRARTASRQPRFHRATLCAALIVACAAVGFAQAGPRVVVENVRLTAHPVELVGVEVAGETHEFAAGRPGEFLASFDAREDWPRQFAFKIRNTSDKAILSVRLDGRIGTGDEGEVPMGIEAIYGRELDESAYTGQAPRGEPRRLAPGETAEVRWSADEHASMLKFLTKKHPLSAYRKMRIDLREARFEDGTVWTMSGLHRIDPNDPRKWTRIDGGPVAGRDEQSPALKPGERIVEDMSARAATGADANTLSVTQISVNGQNVVPGEPFAAGADWLRSLTVRVRNVSAKPITYLQVNLTLPEARYRDGGIGFTFRHPEAWLRGEGGAKPLLPGEEAELSFAPGDYEAKRQFAEKFGGVSEINRVRMGTGTVTFADGKRALVATPVRAPKKTTTTPAVEK